MTAADQPSTAARLPSLDGVRAVAVGLVVLAHSRANGLISIPFVWHWDLGNLGVRIFFVLSGFLITSLLAGELARTGGISLSAFYARRALRIFPAFYAMLLILIGAWRLGLIELDWVSVVCTALYLSNFRFSDDIRISSAVGHTWSLSVEEQFYLLWPAVLRALRPARAIPLLVGLMLLAPVFRVALDQAGYVKLARYGFPTVMDALATGALLALARDRLHRWRPFVRATMTGRGAALAALIPIIAWAGWPMIVRDTIAIFALNITIAALIQWTLSYRAGPAYSFLNWAPVSYLGRASYAIYLWQTPVLTQGDALPRWAPVPLILAIALCSYHLIEQPFLRLRTRFARTRPAQRTGEMTLPRPRRPRPAYRDDEAVVSDVQGQRVRVR